MAKPTLPAIIGEGDMPGFRVLVQAAKSRSFVIGIAHDPIAAMQFLRLVHVLSDEERAIIHHVLSQHERRYERARRVAERLSTLMLTVSTTFGGPTAAGAVIAALSTSQMKPEVAILIWGAFAAGVLTCLIGFWGYNSFASLSAEHAEHAEMCRELRKDIEL
jgi:hypothetical protein